MKKINDYSGERRHSDVEVRSKKQKKRSKRKSTYVKEEEHLPGGGEESRKRGKKLNLRWVQGEPRCFSGGRGGGAQECRLRSGEGRERWTGYGMSPVRREWKRNGLSAVFHFNEKSVFLFGARDGQENSRVKKKEDPGRGIKKKMPSTETSRLAYPAEKREIFRYTIAGKKRQLEIVPEKKGRP